MNVEKTDYAERLLAAVREWRRAQDLADEARREAHAKEQFANEAGRVANSAYASLHALFKDGEK